MTVYKVETKRGGYIWEPRSRVVTILASHIEGPGSIPGQVMIFFSFEDPFLSKFLFT